MKKAAAADFEKPYVSGEPSGRDPRLSFYDHASWRSEYEGNLAYRQEDADALTAYGGMINWELNALKAVNELPGLALEESVDWGLKKGQIGRASCRERVCYAV